MNNEVDPEADMVQLVELEEATLGAELVQIKSLERPGEVIWEGRARNGRLHIHGEDWGRNESADLRGMDLSGAGFYDVEMSGSDLSGANLSGTQFINCGLSGCDLRGALLDGMTLDGSELDDALLDPPSSDDLDGVYLKLDDSEAVGNCERGSIGFARKLVPGGADADGYGFYLLSKGEVIESLEATPAHVILERANGLWRRRAFPPGYWQRFLLALWEAVYRTKEEKGERKRYAS